jgi:hypothetical protein
MSRPHFGAAPAVLDPNRRPPRRQHGGRPRGRVDAASAAEKLGVTTLSTLVMKPAVIGAAVGATVGVKTFAAVGFALGGWMTTGGAGVRSIWGSAGRPRTR